MMAVPRTYLRTLGRWAFAALFIVGGVGHFVATDLYMRIMPPYLPYHRALVLLVPSSSRVAAWGLIALLIAVFPANAFMYQHPERFGVSPTLPLLRLPLQGLLILWAWAYTRRPANGGLSVEIDTLPLEPPGQPRLQ